MTWSSHPEIILKEAIWLGAEKYFFDNEPNITFSENVNMSLQISFTVYLKIKLSMRAFLGFYRNVKVTNRRKKRPAFLLNTKTQTDVCLWACPTVTRLVEATIFKFKS